VIAFTSGIMNTTQPPRKTRLAAVDSMSPALALEIVKSMAQIIKRTQPQSWYLNSLFCFSSDMMASYCFPVNDKLGIITITIYLELIGNVIRLGYSAEW
jgi:hypothetical protein